MRPLLRLGYQAWMFHAAVRVERNYIGTDDIQFSFGPYMFAGATMTIRDRVSLELGGAVSITNTRIGYDVVGQPVAELGRPILELFFLVHILPGEVP